MNDTDLMYAVLSMAAYDAGNPNYEGPSLDSIGSATLKSIQPELEHGFAAVAYQFNGKTVIAFRGTDGVTDLGDDLFGGGGFISEQANDAAAYYRGLFPEQDVYSPDVVFTGHSLGGGLAGLLASLYGKQAFVFDNMAYAAAAETVYGLSTGPYLGGDAVRDTYYGGATPQQINANMIAGWQLDGQFLQGVQSTGTAVGTDVDWGVGAFVPGLHSLSLLVLNMHADLHFSGTDWKSVASAFGQALFDLGADSAIAYWLYSLAACHTETRQPQCCSTTWMTSASCLRHQPFFQTPCQLR